MFIFGFFYSLANSILGATGLRSSKMNCLPADENFFKSMLTAFADDDQWRFKFNRTAMHCKKLRQFISMTEVYISNPIWGASHKDAKLQLSLKKHSNTFSMIHRWRQIMDLTAKADWIKLY